MATRAAPSSFGNDAALGTIGFWIARPEGDLD